MKNEIPVGDEQLAGCDIRESLEIILDIAKKSIKKGKMVPLEVLSAIENVEEFIETME